MLSATCKLTRRFHCLPRRRPLRTMPIDPVAHFIVERLRCRDVND